MLTNRFKIIGLISLTISILMGLWAVNIYHQNVLMKKDIDRLKKEQVVNKKSIRLDQFLFDTFGDNSIYYQINRNIDEFLTVYQTYDNSKDYYARSEKLKKVATDSVLNDSRLFGSDKDKSGNSFIDTMRISSRGQSVEYYPNSNDDPNSGTVAVEVTGEYNHQNPGTVLMIYQVHVNNEHKLDEVEFLGKANPHLNSNKDS